MEKSSLVTGKRLLTAPLLPAEGMKDVRWSPNWQNGRVPRRSSEVFL